MNKIMKAVFTNNVELLSKLLELENDLDVQDKDGRTPLIHAVIDNKIEMIRLLIRKGANVNIQDSIGYSALHYAAQNYLVEVAKVLLENNAVVDVQDIHGNTPLFKAVFNSRGRGEVIRLLVDFGANINLENKHRVSPIGLANTIANFDIVKFMK